MVLFLRHINIIIAYDGAVNLDDDDADGSDDDADESNDDDEC